MFMVGPKWRQLEHSPCHGASRQQQRYGQHLIALEQICGFIRHLIKVWRLGSNFLATVEMLSLWPARLTHPDRQIRKSTLAKYAS